MMVVVLRALSRLTALVVLGAAAIALLVAAGAAAAGAGALADLGDALGTRTAAREADAFLARLAAGGGGVDRTAAALAGLGAVVAGLALVAGALAPRRDRTVALGEDLAVRPAALARNAAWRADDAYGVTTVSARVRRRRRPLRRGRLVVRARLADSAAPGEVDAGVRERLAPLAEAFDLRLGVRLSRPRGRSVA